MGNYLANIFAASPVRPIQEHMEQCYRASDELVDFFRHTIAGDWDAARASRQRIVDLEHTADGLKKQLRGQIPKRLFMPVPREDLLDLIWVQDQIPNRARDISGLVIGREITLPEVIQDSFLAFVARNADAAKMARKTINELDELYETGFQGAEVQLVETLINELDQIEDDTDEMQASIRKQLFDIEQQLPPIEVMFLYRIIELTGDIGDMAERVGRRLELMLAR